MTPLPPSASDLTEEEEGEMESCCDAAARACWRRRGHSLARNWRHSCPKRGLEPLEREPSSPPYSLRGPTGMDLLGADSIANISA